MKAAMTEEQGNEHLKLEDGEAVHNLLNLLTAVTED
jgi:hypothetical protein